VSSVWLSFVFFFLLIDCSVPQLRAFYICSLSGEKEQLHFLRHPPIYSLLSLLSAPRSSHCDTLSYFVKKKKFVRYLSREGEEETIYLDRSVCHNATVVTSSLSSFTNTNDPHIKQVEKKRSREADNTLIRAKIGVVPQLILLLDREVWYSQPAYSSQTQKRYLLTITLDLQSLIIISLCCLLNTRPLHVESQELLFLKRLLPWVFFFSFLMRANSSFFFFSDAALKIENEDVHVELYQVIQ